MRFLIGGGKISVKCIKDKINDYYIRSVTLDNIAFLDKVYILIVYFTQLGRGHVAKVLYEKNILLFIFIYNS